MGQARRLTMGTGRRRSSYDPEIARLRRLSVAASPDPAELLEAINVVRSRVARLRFAEGAALNVACSRYRDLTGEDIGCNVERY